MPTPQHENAYRSQPESGHTSLDPLGNPIPHAASERTDAIPSSTLAEDCLLGISRTSDRMYSLYTKIRHEAYKLSKFRSAKQPPTIVSDDSTALLTGYWKSDEPLADSTLLFELTQGLGDLYVRFMAIGLYIVREPSYPVDDRGPGNNQDATGSESTSSSIASDATILSQLPELDHASILLILSCHLRVVDCWNTIVSLSENCARKALARGSVPTTLIVSTLKVGSFELPEAQAVSVQWILSVQLVRQLWERSRDLASAVQSSLSTNATDGEVFKVDSTAILTERMCHEVQARANSSLKGLERIRDAFVSRDLT